MNVTKLENCPSCGRLEPALELNTTSFGRAIAYLVEALTSEGCHKQWWLEKALREMVSNADVMKRWHQWSDGVPP